MSRVTDLIVQDVRCFQDAHLGRLRPLTLLVGENSTGKSTFLGCYRVLTKLLSSWSFDAGQVDFNEEPFFMGSFRDIVRSRRGRGGRINDFKLGMAVSPRARGGTPFRFWTTFVERGSQPVVSSFRWVFEPDDFLEVRPNSDGGTTFEIPDRQVVTELPFGHLRFSLDAVARGHRLPAATEHIIEYLSRLFPGDKDRRFSRWMLPPTANLVPVAPLRSKPKRTYDPVRETASADGEHVPMLMMRLDRTDKSNWETLHDALVEFGGHSGLFSDIRVKRHGRQMSDPFQLQVKVRGGYHANIMDVGYGVSQSLPILVDIMAGGEDLKRRGRSARTYLLQQPEVHLHPKGQAELASLFVQSFRRHGNEFLIETHSDHILDRVRISVRKELVKADDVSILYFEPTGNSVRLHNLTLDRDGNLTNVPAGYREFFAAETDRLLGFAE